MAKTHEEEKPQRTLTPEEAARRKAALEGGAPAQVRTSPVQQTSDHGGPVQGYLQRLERAAQVPSPMAIDYDRDGYPDALVGRSGRNLDQRIKQVDAEAKMHRTAEYAGQVGRGAVYAVGSDGYRQDQIGYRDRLRARVDAMTEVAEAEGDPVDPEVQALADLGVASHGSTGVPGGTPAGALAPPDVPEATMQVKRPTPLEQAMMAPQTPTTGFVNKGAAIAVPGPGVIPKKPKPPGGGEGGEGGEGEETGPPVQGPEGPFPTSHRGSFGNVPVQGTAQPDGTFTVGNVTATPPPEDAKTKAHGKPSEPVKHEPAKHEPPKHEPAKHEPPKHPEHHGKK
jgi:hypothetical protein